MIFSYFLWNFALFFFFSFFDLIYPYFASFLNARLILLECPLPFNFFSELYSVIYRPKKFPFFFDIFAVCPCREQFSLLFLLLFNWRSDTLALGIGFGSLAVSSVFLIVLNRALYPLTWCACARSDRIRDCGPKPASNRLSRGSAVGDVMRCCLIMGVAALYKT